MDKIKIYAVTPYTGMKMLVDEIGSERTDVKIFSALSALDTVECEVAKIEEMKPDILISRGLTAEYLLQKVDLPLVEIETSSYDILGSIRMAQEYGQKFAVVGFREITHDAELLCNLLKFKTQIVTVEDESGMWNAIHDLKSEGYTLIVGGALTTTIAEKMGLSGITITSGRQSIEAAIEQAIHIHKAYEKKKEQLNALQLALNRNPIMTVIFDQEERIVCETGEGLEKGLLMYLKSMCEAVEKKGSITLVEEIDRETWYIQGQDMNTGKERYSVFYAKSSEAGSRGKFAGVTMINALDVTVHLPAIVYEASVHMNQIISCAGIYAETERVIILEGEKGTERNKIVDFLLKKGPAANGVLIKINLAAAGKKDLSKFVEWAQELKQNHHIMICINNTESASQDLLKQITTMAAQVQWNIVFVTEPGSTSKIYKNYLDEIGAEEFVPILHLPALRERKSDIVNYANLYIAQLSVKKASPVVGLEDDAVELLEAYEWPGNLSELRAVIAIAVKSTKNFYLSGKDITEAMQIINREEQKSTSNINLSGTLLEIEQDIVRIVLQEEDNSRKRTAERLNISRSKLWSMLKSNEE